MWEKIAQFRKAEALTLFLSLGMDNAQGVQLGPNLHVEVPCKMPKIDLQSPGWSCV